MRKIKLFCITVPAISAILAVLGCAALNYRNSSETDLSKSALLTKPPEPLAAPVTITVVTFNIWDLFPAGTNRAERMKGIGQKLVELNPDLIGFQEAFYEGDREIILKELEAAGLVQSRYFHSGFMGSGLLVVSRFPIEEAFFRRYSQWGKFYKLWHGDWWAGKGVCMIRVKLPDGGGYLDFFNTHAHGSYGKGEYEDVIFSNLKECATFVNEATTKTSPAISVGDFNSGMGSQQGKALVGDARFVRVMNLDSGIDHIFVQENPKYDFKILGTVAIQGTVDVGGKKIGLSDHSGYMSTILITPK